MSDRITMQKSNDQQTVFVAATALLNEYETVREFAALQFHQTAALMLQVTQMKAAAICWVSSHGVRLITTCGLGENLLARSLPKDLSFFAPEQVLTSHDSKILQIIEAYLGIDGYQSVVSLPLIAYSKQVMGAVLLLDQKPLDFEVMKLAQLADLVGLVMQGINATREAKLTTYVPAVPLLEQAVMQSQESVIAFDLSGSVLTWNSGATQIYGYSSETMSGQHYKRLLPPEEIAPFQSILRQLQFDQAVIPYETTRIHQSGFRVQVRSSLHLVRNENGVAKGFIEYSGIPSNPARAKAVGHLQNLVITQSQLAQQQAFAEIVLQTIEQGVTVTNAEGCLEYVNSAAQAMIGYAHNELLGRKPADFIVPEQIQQVHKDRLERIEGWQTTSYYKAIRADGSVVTIEAVAYPRRHGQSGEFQGTIALLRDMSLATLVADEPVGISSEVLPNTSLDLSALQLEDITIKRTNLLILPTIEAALAFIHGVGGETFFTAGLEWQSQWKMSKLVLRGRGFKLVVLEGGLENLPSTIKRS
jgi:PAS domain S-box-containing protein